MKAPWNFARFLPLAGRLLARGRLPTLLFAVASKGAREGGRLGKLKEDLRLLQALCLAYWRGEYRAVSAKSMLSVVAGLMLFPQPPGCDSRYLANVWHDRRYRRAGLGHENPRR